MKHMTAAQEAVIWFRKSVQVQSLIDLPQDSDKRVPARITASAKEVVGKPSIVDYAWVDYP